MIIKPFKLERYYTIHEFTAKYLLCSSDCEAMTIGDLLDLEEGAADRFNNHWLGYTESKGSPSLRKDIASINSENLIWWVELKSPIRMSMKCANTHLQRRRVHIQLIFIF